jgi:hypothetical protein
MKGVLGILTQAVKWSGREVRKSLPTSAQVKGYTCSPPPPHVLMARCMIKHTDNF